MRRLATPLLRRRFVAARGLLRELLAPLLCVLPEELEIEAGAGGKPRVDGGPFFNLAHCGELAVFALGPAEVGVDVERVRPLRDRDRVAAEVFTPRERSALDTVAAERRDEAFAVGWTRKESYLKARGDGLGIPLQRLEVTVRPDEPARLLWVADEPREPARWSLTTFVPAPGYVGALAVELAV
jgi:4'-phosphopantetheinyl transferase